MASDALHIYPHEPRDDCHDSYPRRQSTYLPSSLSSEKSLLDFRNRMTHQFKKDTIYVRPVICTNDQQNPKIPKVRHLGWLTIPYFPQHHGVDLQHHDRGKSQRVCDCLTGLCNLSRLRPVSGVNYIAPTRLADGKASLDPLRSVQFRPCAANSLHREIMRRSGLPRTRVRTARTHTCGSLRNRSSPDHVFTTRAAHAHRAVSSQLTLAPCLTFPNAPCPRLHY